MGSGKSLRAVEPDCVSISVALMMAQTSLAARRSEALKVFWNDCGRGVEARSPQTCGLEEAWNIWSDEVRGIQGNFLGLVDPRGNVVQFYFEASIPNSVDDAEHLRIVRLDCPVPAERGSYVRPATIGEVARIIEQVYTVGAIDPRSLDTKFDPW